MIAPVIICLSLFTSLCAEFPTPTNNQPETIPLTPPEKTIGMMHLPPGFKATLFAHEPDVRQPIAMCWDEHGRLWIAENYTYSDGNERFDMKLKDRILIFEDTDNDGHFDKRTVFCDDLQMLTSIERGFGGVYALCPPNLLWIPTKNDRPSGPPQILLDGFCTTAQSRHTLANGLKWGPDGWLYGRVGISSTSWVGVPGDGSTDTPVRNQADGGTAASSNEADRSVRAPLQRQPTAGGIWRYHPTRKIYEPYCHGTTNPWGMDWDEHGEMFFINTVIGHLWHGIQGAHYKRMHGEDPASHIYGLIDQHADHYHWDTGKKWNETRDAKGLTDELGGGHAHTGLMIYQGTNFPKEYRGKVFTNNLHGHRVNVDRIEREGSGYVGKHDPDFMKTDDPWFRPVEIQYGPDGGVYILDWCDIGECHEQDGVHRTSGRIYKITYGDPVKPKETDVGKLSDEELVKLQLSDNEWLVRMARWEIRERYYRLTAEEERILALGNGSCSPNRQIYIMRVADVLRSVLEDKSASAKVRLNSLWTLGQIEYPRNVQLDSLSGSGSVYLESWRCKALHSCFGYFPYYLGNAFDCFGKPHIAKQLDALPPEERKDKVTPERLEARTREFILEQSLKSCSTQSLRLVLIGSLPRPIDTKIAQSLLSHAEDATDHNLPLMYWYGIRDLPPAELVKLVKDCRIPLVTQFITRRITEDIDKDPAPLNTLLELASNTGFQPVGPTGVPPVAEIANNGQDARSTHSKDGCATSILRGMTDALKGWRKAKKPEAWDAFADVVARHSDVGTRTSPDSTSESRATPTAMLRDLNVLFGDGRALDEIRAVALDDNADVEARKSALATLVEAKSPDARKICEKLLTERSLSVAAVQGLATFDDPAIGEMIVRHWGIFYTTEHAAVIAALASRPGFAKVLLAHLEGSAGVTPVASSAHNNGQDARAPLIPRTEITPVIARQIRSFNDEALNKKLAEVWGEVHDSSEDKKSLIAALKTKLTPEFIAKGDPSQGRMLFNGICAACHKLYGEGGDIGADLTGSGRHDAGYLIENIIDPSAVVAADFTMAVVTLKDGRVLNGIISEKTDRTVTLKMVGQKVTVDRNDVVKQEQLPISMMPEGQLNVLSDKQIADFFSYLMSSAQVPMPK